MIQMRAVRPKVKFPSRVFREEMVAEAARVRDDIFKDFDKTTATWKHKPTFASGVELGGGRIKVEVKTDNEIYGYVTRGTSPHIIRPKNAKSLRFNSGFYAKTFPHVIGSVAGGGFGGPRCCA